MFAIFEKKLKYLKFSESSFKGMEEADNTIEQKIDSPKEQSAPVEKSPELVAKKSTDPPAYDPNLKGDVQGEAIKKYLTERVKKHEYDAFCIDC